MKPKTLANVFGNVVLLDVKADDKQQILTEIVAAACKKPRMGKKKQATVLAKVLAREELGSTGIGAGSAVPHAKVREAQKLLGAFARSAQPIDYDAVDGEPVRLFFLLISPEDSASGYLEALSCLSRALRDRKFCNFLRTAKNKKDVVYALSEISLSPPARS